MTQRKWCDFLINEHDWPANKAAEAIMNKPSTMRYDRYINKIIKEFELSQD